MLKDRFSFKYTPPVHPYCLPYLKCKCAYSCTQTTISLQLPALCLALVPARATMCNRPPQSVTDKYQMQTHVAFHRHDLPMECDVPASHNPIAKSICICSAKIV